MSKLMFNFCLLLVVSYFLINCSGGRKSSKIDALEQEVLEIHNKLMPLMGEVARLKDELEKGREDLDSLAAGQFEEVDALLLELSDANEGMMNWMRSYSADFQEMKEEEIEKYLKEQKEEIREVEDRITRAIAAAKKELGK